MPDPAAANHRLYQEAAGLLRELEAAANDGALDGVALAGEFVSIVAAHIDPLRAAVSDVEFYREAERIVAMIGGADQPGAA